MADASIWRRAASLAGAAACAALVACGGGGGGSGVETVAAAAAAAPEKPASRDEAARFLAQASFGPADADIDHVQALGYAGWIDEQLALPASGHRAHWEAADAKLKLATPSASAGQDQVLDAFWTHALTAPDQLRQRVAFALSQIFVISMADASVGDKPRAVAAWMDMLGTQGLGNYRTLLESVSRHPLMGHYLSHLRNQRADPRTGRVPDENYAREVMQLFSIGLVALDEDGSARATPSYDGSDVAGLARVFTGWSWACPNWPDNNCFQRGTADGASDPDRDFKSMLGYPQYHSAEEKRFLGSTVAAQAQADPGASLKTALDTLHAHPNVGPFIGRQLIQRLVTSNPSPAYVRAVARAFADNGAGVRGDMAAVVKAVLLHPEARLVSATSGKLREPVLRLSAFLRAFPHVSDTGRHRVGNTDSVSDALGQTPLRAPSVFNFYRPGYVPPGTGAAARGLVAPELQIVHETSAAGYVNFMRDNVSLGVGQSNGTVDGVRLNRRDLQAGYATELALAGDPAALVERIAGRLTYGSASAALKSEISSAVASITIPALNSSASNQRAIDDARRQRVNAALLLVLAAPEFQVLP